MKKLIILISIVISYNLSVSAQQKTQAYLGLKEGGEWKWVTKTNGNEHFEYHWQRFLTLQIYEA